MKKILSLALALSATALLACPIQGGMMKPCQCDTNILPKPFEKLGLSDEQKEQIKQLREEAKEFHNKQHEKMMAVLTPEQRAKFDAMRPMNAKQCKTGQMQMKKGMQPTDASGDKAPAMPMQGMGCKNCPQAPETK